MPVDVHVEVFGEPIIRRRLLRTAGSVTDATPAWHAIARLLGRGAAKQFATAGGYGGTPWAALRPATIARKLRLGLNPAILRATNRLYNSLVLDAGPEHVAEFGEDFMRWGSSVPYGVYHQSRAPRRKIPYRPPVKLAPTDRRNAVRILQRTLFGGGL